MQYSIAIINGNAETKPRNRVHIRARVTTIAALGAFLCKMQLSINPVICICRIDQSEEKDESVRPPIREIDVGSPGKEDVFLVGAKAKQEMNITMKKAQWHEDYSKLD